jgi:hypothetical protein
MEVEMAMKLLTKRLNEICAAAEALQNQYARWKHKSLEHNQLYENTRDAKRCLIDAIRAAETIEQRGKQ